MRVSCRKAKVCQYGGGGGTLLQFLCDIRIFRKRGQVLQMFICPRAVHEVKSEEVQKLD